MQVDARAQRVEAEDGQGRGHGHVREPGQQRQGERGRRPEPQRAPAREGECTGTPRCVTHDRRADRRQHPGQQHHQRRRRREQPHPPVQLRQPPQRHRLVRTGTEQIVQRVRQEAGQLARGPAVPRHEQAQRHAQPHPVRRPEQRCPGDAARMVVADRRVRRRREPRRHGHQQHRHHRGHRRPHDPVHGLPARRQRRTAGRQQSDDEDPGRPPEPAEQRRRRVHREADRRLRVDQLAEPVRQQPPDVPEPRDFHTPAPAGHVVKAQRPPVDRDHIVSRPRQPAQHRHEERDHRARAREEFGRRNHNSRPAQGPQEEPRQQHRPGQAHPQWRDLDGRVRLRARQTERRHVTGRRDRPASRERHHRRGHRPQRARRVRLQQPQTQRRRPRHPDQRPAHGGDGGHQHVSPRHARTVPRRLHTGRSTHGRPPDPLRGGNTAHVPLASKYHSPARFPPRQRKRRTRPRALFTRPDFRSGGRS